jgi:hypothetical protein
VLKKLSIAFQRTFDFADYLHTKPTPSSFVPLERGLRVRVARISGPQTKLVDWIAELTRRLLFVEDSRLLGVNCGERVRLERRIVNHLGHPILRISPRQVFAPQWHGYGSCFQSNA